MEGKIVLCDKFGAFSAAFSAGAVGTVIQGIAAQEVAFAYPLPASRFDENSGLNICIYVNSTRYIWIKACRLQKIVFLN